VDDSALIMEVISGKDDHDATVSGRDVPTYSDLLSSDQKYKLVLLQNCVKQEGVDTEIQAYFDYMMGGLEGNGYSSTSVDFPYLEYGIPVYYVLATAEASSNLARFSGMTYGYRTQNAESLEDIITHSRSEGFGEEVKRRIMLGTFVLSEGFYDAYYSKAQKVRQVITTYTQGLLEENDFIILPTSPTTAFALGENTADPIAMYLADIFTLQSSIAGLPSISLPLGTHSNGMPFGIQLIGRRFEEEKMLSFSKYLMENFKN
jgi:aspartyl-tRNA(Asn)/glutamyl-tRNA(Gln) amidotransferase subunit A